MLFSLAFFFIKDGDRRGAQPFFAKIVTPDELRESRKARSVGLPRKPAVVSSQKDTAKQRLNEPLEKGIQQLEDMSSKKAAQDKDSEIASAAGKTDSLQHQSQPQLADGLSGMPQKNILGGESMSPLPQKPLEEKLFDRDVIGRLALKENEKEKPKQQSSFTFDTAEFKYHGYLKRLRERIEGTWKYPPDAAERGIYGDLYIQFTIKRNGQLGAVELVRTSGHKSLDDAAIRALKDAEPYWPLPDEWGKEGMTITGHFVYSLYGAYIR
ncbi:MAG: energy transducer TonB [Thermodesulfovibrionales bacterium]|nr:energy transducer TonB [Thermodesulfovibrionales bacterium]